MRVETSISAHRSIPEAVKVVIVGAGPVGLTASLLLSKYRVPHLVVEQLTEPENHPQAHFINRRSMEILRELGGLDQTVQNRSAPMGEWRRFVYCTRLAGLPATLRKNEKTTGSLLGAVDHFADIPKNDGHSPVQVTHFPQHNFMHLLYRKAVEKTYCHFVVGHQANVRDYPYGATIILTNCQTGQRHEIQTQFVVGADGAHSSTRKQLNIDLDSATGTLQHLINVHFFSAHLSKQLKANLPAMLYFLYSSAGVGVLVAHAFNQDEFVAQIPFFPPHQLSTDFDANRCRTLLQKWTGASIDIRINSIRPWRMGVGVASRFQSKNGRCFLIGDAAHQFTPAGGFGMNTGIQDAHNLIWKIVTALEHNNTSLSDSDKNLLASYEVERQPIARLNAKISVQNFYKTLEVSNAIGLDLTTANWLSRMLDRIPGPQSVKSCLFQTAIRLGLQQVKWLKSHHVIARRRRNAISHIFKNARKQTLQLLFPGQDLGFIYTKGFLIGAKTSNMDQFDPFAFQPELRVGGRLPHFWIVDKNGNRMSVLDLPSLMSADAGMPLHVLLVIGLEKKDIKKCKDTIETLIPRTKYTITKLDSDFQGETQFTFHHPSPAFLPASFAVLIRPDGHIGWMHIASHI